MAVDLGLTLLWDDRAPRNAAAQMATDAAMLDLAAEGACILRLYQWERDTVSLGANEAANAHWDQAALARDGVPVVRRPTGGRAVWHAADDLTYAWSGPVAAVGGVREGYALLHRILAEAIASLGAAPVLASRPASLPGLAPGACFDVPVGGEVLVDGRKAIGSAQLVRQEALLQHGAIARTDRGEALARYRLGGSVPPRTGTPCGALPSARHLREVVLAAWRARGAREAPPELISRIEAVTLHHAAHHADPAWTWRR